VEGERIKQQQQQQQQQKRILSFNLQLVQHRYVWFLEFTFRPYGQSVCSTFGLSQKLSGLTLEHILITYATGSADLDVSVSQRTHKHAQKRSNTCRFFFISSFGCGRRGR
jgi:hypothetical protein